MRSIDHFPLRTRIHSTPIVYRAAVALAAVGWLLAMAGPAPAQQDLAALIQQARDSFQPVNAEQLAAARTVLSQRMDELEQFVRPTSANGQKWLKYLRWDTLKEQLAAAGPANLEPFDATLRQLNNDENGLELPRFRRLTDALERYRDLTAVSLWENPADLYGSQLDALARMLDAYRSEPSPDAELAVGRQLKIVTSLGQAPELVTAVRRELAQPNAFIDVSAALLAAAAEPIDRREPVTDNILGTRINSDAHTIGTVVITTIPADDRAVLELKSTGRVESQNVGTNGPAVIRSTGVTDYTATKRVELSDAEFRADPAKATATTNSDIHSIGKRGGGLGSRMVSNIGWQRARQNHSRADAIAADHAEDRIERRFNEETSDKLRDARKRYEDEYRRPLVRRGELPEHIRFNSATDALALEVAQANAGQLAASGAPPAPPEGHDMTMRLHESAVNNYSASLLGGATASETEPGQKARFDVKLPDWMKKAWEKRKTDSSDGEAATDEPFQEWSLTFRPERPLSVDFADGKVTLTIHIARLKSGADQRFTNWDVTGTFSPELKDGGVVLRREGDLVVLPTGFDTKGGRLSSVQVGERSNLEKELNQRSAQGRGFPATIEFAALEPEGALEDAGPLAMQECISDNGWLILAWDRAQE